MVDSHRSRRRRRRSSHGPGGLRYGGDGSDGSQEAVVVGEGAADRDAGVGAGPVRDRHLVERVHDGGDRQCPGERRVGGDQLEPGEGDEREHGGPVADLVEQLRSLRPVAVHPAGEGAPRAHPAPQVAEHGRGERDDEPEVDPHEHRRDVVAAGGAVDEAAEESESEPGKPEPAEQAIEDAQTRGVEEPVARAGLQPG